MFILSDEQWPAGPVPVPTSGYLGTSREAPRALISSWFPQYCRTCSVLQGPPYSSSFSRWAGVGTGWGVGFKGKRPKKSGGQGDARVATD